VRVEVGFSNLHPSRARLVTGVGDAQVVLFADTGALYPLEHNTQRKTHFSIPLSTHYSGIEP
jgi:hypothetical protein